MVPKRTLEDIRFRNDIVEVISSYFTLNKAGSAFKACCPFHKEKTPSFHVNPQRQIFHCFGCGEGGDVFAFLMKYEGLDFSGAIKMLAQRAGIAIKLEEGEKGSSEKATLYEMHSEVARLYHQALLERKSAQGARKYLEDRGLTKETIDSFNIGYAPDRWDSVVKWAEKEYDLKLAETAGLAIKSTKKNSRVDYYDRFRNRIMFPIVDEQGRIVAFSGRALSEDAKEAKYVNSPQTPLFHKGRILYGLNSARKHIVKSREVLVCEGQIDVIRCHQEGFYTAVASQGTAFTEDHVRILQRYADSVCIIFDMDKAGQDAAVKTAILFMGAGLAVRIAALPEKEDPDSYIKEKGPQAFQSMLDKATSIVNFQIQVYSARENMQSEIGVMRVARQVLKTISMSPNAVQRAKLVQEAAGLLNLPASALQDDLKFVIKKESHIQPSRPETTPPKAKQNISRDELWLCENMVRIVDCPELKDIVIKYLPIHLLKDFYCTEIVKAALQSLETGEQIQDILRVAHQDEEGLHAFAAKVQMVPAMVKGKEFTREDDVKGIILRLWQRKLKKEREHAEAIRKSQITYDLNALKLWDTGVAIIELELEED